MMKEEAVSMAQNDAILESLLVMKKLAGRYRVPTGKPLGITGEVAEYEAARLLELELIIARQAGYDAIRSQDGKITRYQVKGRCGLPGSKPAVMGDPQSPQRTNPRFSEANLCRPSHFEAEAVRW
jgi:hypothetical protein